VGAVGDGGGYAGFGGGWAFSTWPAPASRLVLDRWPGRRRAPHPREHSSTATFRRFSWIQRGKQGQGEGWGNLVRERRARETEGCGGDGVCCAPIGVPPTAVLWLELDRERLR
jgi:hypothetical protein